MRVRHAEETAVYFVNGETLSDHRHNDNGEVVIYALGAPLSVDWGPIYYPRVGRGDDAQPGAARGGTGPAVGGG